MNELNVDTTVFDEEYRQQELERTLKQAEASRQAASQEETATAPPKPAAPDTAKQEEPEPEPGSLLDVNFFGQKKDITGGVLDSTNQFVDETSAAIDKQREEGFTTDNMTGSQRGVAGTIDTIMDLTSKFIPAMQDPADWWDEKTGRKTSNDPLKKAERDIAAIVIPSLVGGYGINAAGLTGAPAVGANLGLEALISGTSDTTSDPGNIGSMIEGPLQKVVPNAQIPWASRDSDSPDVIFWKNMAENLFTAGVFSTLAELPTILTHGKAGNKIIPKDDVAQTIVDAIPEKPTQLGKALEAAAAKKQAEQVKIGQRALQADPEGVNGYNAFVNEPAEQVARATVDETANTAEFMADNARIQNNVGY